MATSSTSSQTVRSDVEMQMLEVVRELLTELGSHQTAQQVRPIRRSSAISGWAASSASSCLCASKAVSSAGCPTISRSAPKRLPTGSKSLSGRGRVHRQALSDPPARRSLPPAPENLRALRTSFARPRAGASRARADSPARGRRRPGHQLRPVVRAGVAGRGRAASRRTPSANETVAIMLPTGRRFLLRLFRSDAGRRHRRADLSAGARQPDRGVRQPPGADPAERGGAVSDLVRSGARGGADDAPEAAKPARGHHRSLADRARPSGGHPQRCRRRTRFSFNTPRAAPATRKASC